MNVLRAGVLEEALMIDSEAKFYDEIKRYLKEAANLTLEWTRLNQNDLDNIEIFGRNETIVDLFIYPIELIIFDSFLRKHTRVSAPYAESMYILISNPPPMLKISNTTLVNVDNAVLGLILIFLFALTTLWCVIHYIKKDPKFISRSRSSNHAWTKLVNFTETFYGFLVTLLGNSFLEIPRYHAVRVFMIIWLISAQFVIIQFAAVLQADFADITYDYIDSIETLLRHPDKRLKALENSPEKYFLTNMAIDNENYRTLYERNKETMSIEAYDLFDEEFYTKFDKDVILFGSSRIMEVILYHALKDSHSSVRLFFSKEVRANTVSIIYPTNGQLWKSHKERDFIDNRLMTVLFETQWLHYFLYTKKILIDAITWKEEQPETGPLLFVNIYRLFFLVFFGNLFSTLICIIECVTHRGKTRVIKVKKAQRRLYLLRRNFFLE